MSDSTDVSPTDEVSPLASGSRDTSMNGFTAVNGRSSTPQNGTKVVRISDDDRPRSHDEDTRNGNGNEDRPSRLNGTDVQRNGSPLNGTHKRKRSLVEVNDDDSEDTERTSASPDVVGRHLGPHPGYHRTTVEDGPEPNWNGRPHQDTEARLAEALQRESQHNGNGHNGAMESDQINGASARAGYQQDEYTGMITTNAGVQMDPKKRKRAFTNRTKTGCQTCRRRKKKCDEAKPECNNCQRGGFVCEGYAAKSPWPKPTTTKQLPQPIQSREIYGDPGNLYPRLPRNDTYTDSPTHMHPSMRNRQLTIDDDIQERPMNNNGWPNSSYSASHRSYNTDREPSHGLPVHNHSLQVRDYDRPMSSSTLHSGMSSAHSHSLHPNQSPVGGVAVGIAQRALNQQPLMPYSNPINEKEKMLNGDLYKPFSRMLQDDREKCQKLLLHFNTNHGINREERARLLRNVLEPQDLPIARGGAPSVQRVGKGLAVDPPFRCDYGYNISIGQDVSIESGCFISDPRDVHIGEETMIGPDVKIMGKVYPYHHGDRSGQLNGKARGYKIIIGKQVHIGAGVVISPMEELCKNGELHIGDGAYIMPGTTVVKDVASYSVFGHQLRDLADVVRPLYGPGEDKRRMGRDIAP